MKKILALILSIAITLSGCASTPANPVPVAQVGDDTKTCDAIVNEMQQMITAQDKAAADRDKQIGTNAALGVTGIFLIVPWFFMDLGSTATVEQKAAQARFQRLQQMAIDKKCPNTPVMKNEEAKEVKKTNFANLDDVNSVPYLKDSGRKAYREFLAANTQSRAFAISENGNYGWQWGNTNTKEKALERCNSFSSVPCKLYAVDNDVVWIAPQKNSQNLTSQSSTSSMTTGSNKDNLPNPAKRLEELNELFKRGLITQKEYDSKKVEILKSL